MAGKPTKKSTAPFFKLERRLVQSPGYRSLSATARLVLVELMAQSNGKNNGDLSATRTMAKEWGIGSPATLQKALTELGNAGWIVQTRSSLFSRHGSRCALYALAWLRIDECPGKGLEVAPTNAPPRPLPTLLGSISSGSESEQGPVQKVNT
ncbi:helix-turn-helix domain-containing protein [Stutzerimonas zhaodongensis]|jgi:hypothetical protein|uniref:Helix-turn-helix domain-containing protein n=1 Tax=Stutzerimonas zhaodongensis TaxID=1176257 RepID=A0ABX8IQV5_9GAMM|nr:helix-turn-helix domain-containing protein [Stutzerimonas zhaodongensis]QWV15480.1 helix-turn-helix domain-containing protein [Stutzerimonas zhaodongensis]